MKKLLMVMLCIFTIAIGAQAQTEVKVKKTTTPVQKVHNVTHRHKHYKGYKTKRRYADGHVRKKKVNHRTGEVEVK